MAEIYSVFNLFILSICIIATLSLFMFIKKLYELKNSKPQDINSTLAPPSKEPAKPEDIGIVVDEKYIKYQGQKLEYFVLKKHNNGNDRLPIGTKVRVLKKSSSEAHVEPVKS